jgi:hypothetical protein
MTSCVGPKVHTPTVTGYPDLAVEFVSFGAGQRLIVTAVPSRADR